MRRVARKWEEDGNMFIVAERSGQEKCTGIKESDKGAMRKRIKGNNCKS